MYTLTFDEDTALVDGLPVRLTSLVFNIITGVAIALTTPAAGALLVSTIMVLPASIGIRVGKSFKAVIISSIIIGSYRYAFRSYIILYLGDTSQCDHYSYFYCYFFRVLVC